MRKRSLGKGFFLILLMGVILIAMSVILVFSLQTDEVGDILKNDQLIKMLLVLHDGDDIVWTDVLVYYPVSRRGAVFDIPGNTGAIYKSLNRTDRIDAVYREKGLATYCSEIEKLTGTQIPFILEMSMADFSYITDLLGGLRIFVPYPVDVVEQGVHYLLPSGAVVLDGDKICTYLEYRLPEDTSVTIQDRKQNSVVAFLSAINSNKSTLLTEKVFSLFASHIKANVDEKGLFSIFSEISTIDADRLMPKTVDGKEKDVQGETLLFPSYDAQLIKDVFKQTTTALISASGVATSRVYFVEIQNGTTKNGLAKNTGALLQSAGYEVLSMINADSTDYERTVVIDHIGNEMEASSLASFINCTNIITDEIKTDDELEADTLVDFTIILGQDFDGRYVR
ncbi:MAG: LCP family protein [Treponemataceae bacterium]|nr:LCP family protein [Treponemataceae bacterium]